jgi:hypothetical protein
VEIEYQEHKKAGAGAICGFGINLKSPLNFLIRNLPPEFYKSKKGVPDALGAP